MSVTFVIAGGCAGACGLGHHLMSSLVSEGCTSMRVMPIWVACTATWGHVDNLAQVAAKDHVLLPQLVSVLMSLVHVGARGHADASLQGGGGTVLGHNL